MWAKQFLCLTTTESKAKIWYQKNAFGPPPLNCCLFWDGGSVAVDKLFIVALIVCGISVFCACFHVSGNIGRPMD